MKILLYVLLFCGVPAVAQVTFQPAGMPPEFKAYLQLTESQERMVLKNDRDYEQWHFEKQLRIVEVQREIFAETQREVLDANALGVR